MGRRYDATTVFNANFEIGKAAPIDNREVVETYADLETAIGVNKYVGELVYVTTDSTVSNVTYPKGYYMYNGTAWVQFKSAVPQVLRFV